MKMVPLGALRHVATCTGQATGQQVAATATGLHGQAAISGTCNLTPRILRRLVTAARQGRGITSMIRVLYICLRRKRDAKCCYLRCLGFVQFASLRQH